MSNSFFVVPPGIEPGTQGQFIGTVSPLLYQLSYVVVYNKKRVTQMSNSFFLWCHQESNRGHKDFQSFALPSELWHQLLKKLDFFLASAKVVLLFRSAKYFGNFFQIISFP